MKNKFWEIFSDSNVEGAYLKEKLKNRFLLFSINLISLIYSISNLVLYYINYDLCKDIKSLYLYTALVINFLVFISPYFFRNNFKIAMLLAYIQNILISSCHLIFINILKLTNEPDDEGKQKFSISCFFLLIFTSSDILIKQIWIILPFNNFIFYFISNFCFFIFFCIFLQTNFIEYELKELTSIVIYLFCVGLLCNFSRIIMSNEKKLFISCSNNHDENTSPIMIENNLNLGYLKIKNFEKIFHNNFFVTEKEFFKVYSQKYGENNSMNKYCKFVNNEKFCNRIESNKENEFTEVEIKEIIKNIILNINPEQNFKSYFDSYNRSLYMQSSVNGKNLEIKDSNKFQSESNLKANKFTDLDNSTNNLLQINSDVKGNILLNFQANFNLEVKTNHTKCKNDFKSDEINHSEIMPSLKNLNSEKFLHNSKSLKIGEINDSICSFEQVLDYFYQNHLKYENLTSIGKIIFNQQGNKILSLEVLFKVTISNNKFNDVPEKYIEIILNDITKTELRSHLKNLLLKTGQYLHDFKNPLICIDNEISELKEENEALISMLYKQNEFIQNLNKSVLSSPKMKNIITKNFDFCLDNCLLNMEKFDYAKQLSEYCQIMIGSYEDFSKSIFDPESIGINYKNFDLFSLLNFVDNFMQIQINRSNKNLKFNLYLENFENGNNDINDAVNKNKNNFLSNEYPLISETKNQNEMSKANLLKTLEYFNLKNKEEFISTDESKLKRVLINILSNSLKFTLSGSITLIVKKEQPAAASNYNYHFSLQDSGIGISESDLKKLFTPFFSNNKSEMNKNGVGLGLINVKEITEKLGEGLKVTSKLNKGTNMSFLVYDKSLKNTESKEDREERAVIIMRDGKNFKNIDEISESSENYEQRTIEISDHIFMIENKLKLKKLKFLNNEMTDRDLLSSLYSNISSGKGNTNNSNLISEQICNNSFSNKKIGVNFRNDLKKENTNSNFLLPFSNSSIVYQRNRRKSHTKIDSSNSLNIISNKSNQKIKLTNSICNRSSKLLKLNSEKTKIFKNMSKIFQFTFTNLNPVVEINFEISSAKNLVSRSGKHKFSTRKNYYTKFGNFDEENSLQETNVTRRKSSGLKSLLFKRFNTLKNNEDSLPISLESRNTIEKTKNVNVLIIDDEKSMRSFSKNILKKLSEKININFIIDEAQD